MLLEVGIVVVLVGFAKPAAAQQNFFNVPASDVTARGKIFFQEQVNILASQKKLQSNSHFAFGLPHDLEVGFNFSHVNIKPFDRRVLPFNSRDRSEPFNPLLLGTAQKYFRAGRYLGFSVGTQTGLNLGGDGSDKRVASLSYANVVLLLPTPHTRLVMGAYWGNDVFLGSSAGFGVWGGVEMQVLPERVHLVADWISGSHDLGLGVFGANVFFSRDVSIVFGPIVPNPRSGNGTGYVVELNVLDLASALGVRRSTSPPPH